MVFECLRTNMPSSKKAENTGISWRHPLTPIKDRLGSFWTVALLIGAMVVIAVGTSYFQKEGSFGVSAAIIGIILLLMTGPFGKESRFEPALSQKHVEGVITQVIPPGEIDSMAIWGGTKYHVESENRYLTTIRVGYESPFHERLSKVPIIGRFAKSEAVHVAFDEPVSEGDEVEIDVSEVTVEKALDIYEKQ